MKVSVPSSMTWTLKLLTRDCRHLSAGYSEFSLVPAPASVGLPGRMTPVRTQSMDLVVASSPVGPTVPILTRYQQRLRSPGVIEQDWNDSISHAFFIKVMVWRNRCGFIFRIEELRTPINLASEQQEQVSKPQRGTQNWITLSAITLPHIKCSCWLLIKSWFSLKSN